MHNTGRILETVLGGPKHRQRRGKLDFHMKANYTIGNDLSVITTVDYSRDQECERINVRFHVNGTENE